RGDQIAAQCNECHEKGQKDQSSVCDDAQNGIGTAVGGNAADPEIAIAVHGLTVVVHIPEVLSASYLLHLIHDQRGCAGKPCGSTSVEKVALRIIHGDIDALFQIIDIIVKGQKSVLIINFRKSLQNRVSQPGSCIGQDLDAADGEQYDQGQDDEKGHEGRIPEG